MSNAIVELVNERRQKAEQLYSSLFRKVIRWYNAYRGIYTGRYQQFRNNISIPLLFSVVQSDVARKTQTCFGQQPFVEFETDIHEMSLNAQKVTSLVNLQMQDDDILPKANDFFLCGDLYGTAVGRVAWKIDYRKSPRIVPTPDGQLIEQILDVEHFNGPSFKNIDMIDFLPEPGARNVEDAIWVIETYYLDFDQCINLAEQGIFDVNAVVELGREGMPSDKSNEYQRRRNIYGTPSDFRRQKFDKFSKPIKITEMWGKIPLAMAPDGVVDRVISLGNDRVILRDRPNPYLHGRKPYLNYSPMPDPHFFHGPGKVEISERLQYAANRYANQQMDAMDLVIDPVWIFNRQSGIDSQNLFTRAGRVIGADGPVDDTVIRPISPDLKGLQLAWTEIQTLWGHIQQGSGIVEDTVQGGPPATSRQTAREFLGRQENVMTRLMLEARLADAGFVEPLANMYYELDQQYLDLPRQIRMMGSAAMIDPNTGFPIPQYSGLATITQFDLYNCYDARARGATTMLGRAARMQAAAWLNSMVAANPVGMMMVNWGAWFKTLFEMAEFPSNNYLLMDGPTMANAVGLLMQGGGANGGGGSETTGMPALGNSQ